MQKLFSQIGFMLCLALPFYAKAGTQHYSWQHMASQTTRQNSQGLTDVAKDYWDTMLRLSPLSATENNIPGYNDQLDDVSAVGRADRHKQKLRLLQALENVDRSVLKPAEQDTWDILKYMLSISLEEDNFKLYRWDVDHLYGPQTTFPIVMLRSQPTSTEKDAQDYIARLKCIRKYLNDHINNLKEGLAVNQTSTRVAVQRTIDIIENLLNLPIDESAFAAVGKKFNSSLQAKYMLEILNVIETSVYPAFHAYHDFLQYDYLQFARPDKKPGLIYMPEGKALYEFAIKYHTTLAITGEEIHQHGLQDLARIHQEILVIAKRAGHTGDVLSFMKKMTNDPNNFFTRSEDIENAANAVVMKTRDKLSAYFSYIPKTPLVVKPMEAFRAKNGIGGQYNAPPIDLSRPGIFYINTSRPDIRPRYVVTALAAHEALPGHHMQIATQLEQGDFPEFRRVSRTTVFTEGWGLYSERLADEMGIYEDDVAKFGMLTMQAFRAARLVVDTGLHSMGWSRQQAVDFMATNVPMKQEEIYQEVDRYLSSTTLGHIRAGQALAYKMGQYEIESMGREAEKALGSKFDLRHFHFVLARNGSAPMPILRQIVHRELGFE